MGREYKIRCEPLAGARLSTALQKLPSPLSRSHRHEIYNFRVDKDGYYLVDHLIDRSVVAVALQVFLDAALSNNQSVLIEEP